jgi:hypothetical protein
MKSDLKIDYEISDLGMLARKRSMELSLLEITNYSIEGDLIISSSEKRLILVKVPLLEAFHAIRETLKIFPIFAEKVAYDQMFREAHTYFSISEGLMLIEHIEIPPLKERAGAPSLRVDYVEFCREFGCAAKKFLWQTENISPSLLQDERIKEKYFDLIVLQNSVPGKTFHVV